MLGASIAASVWLRRRSRRNAQLAQREETVDSASEDSFPASDPPAFSGASASGSP
jgi:hypothetical protein